MTTEIITFMRGAQFSSLTLNDRISYAIQPFVQALLDEFVQVNDFSTAVETAVRQQPTISEGFFDITLSDGGTCFSLKPQWLFPKSNPLLALNYRNARYPHYLVPDGTQALQDEAILPEIHHLLYLCGQANLSYDQIHQQISEPIASLLDDWLRCKIVKAQPEPILPTPHYPPGVFRLQHAALLYRTATTGILIDPHLHSNYGIPTLEQDITRAHLEGSVDAILISHSHYDHWHHPTLMMFAPETPIVVPKVPRGSFTCDDMQARLHSLGFQNVIAVDWYADPIQIGDITIHVLPFYGEQPIVPECEHIQHPDLRNWGNTYLIETEDFTSWCLVDAGTEPNSSMLEVASYVAQQFGYIDQVVSNFQALSYNSIGTDLSKWGIDIVANLLSNPRILSLTNQHQGEYIATLGPPCLAELCTVVGAKACLPYAHSWAKLGDRCVHDITLVPAVEDELRRLGGTTQVIPWAIGDGYVKGQIVNAFRQTE